jgi:hypothetical protein
MTDDRKQQEFQRLMFAVAEEPVLKFLNYLFKEEDCQFDPKVTPYEPIKYKFANDEKILTIGLRVDFVNQSFKSKALDKVYDTKEVKDTIDFLKYAITNVHVSLVNCITDKSIKDMASNIDFSYDETRGVFNVSYVSSEMRLLNHYEHMISKVLNKPPAQLSDTDKQVLNDYHPKIVQLAEKTNSKEFLSYKKSMDEYYKSTLPTLYVEIETTDMLSMSARKLPRIEGDSIYDKK